MNIKKNKGFTLIETIIYLALLSFLIGSMTAFAYNIFESVSAANNHAVVYEEANFIIIKIGHALTGAESVLVGDNFFTAIYAKNSQSAFVFDGQEIKLNKQPLNSSSIAVSDVSFTVKDNIFNAAFTLSSLQSGRNYSRTFYLSKNIKNEQ